MKNVKLDWKLLHYVERKTNGIRMYFKLLADVVDVVVGLLLLL